MSNVWYAIPTVKSLGEWTTLDRWRLAGYKLALFQDAGKLQVPASLTISGKYEGYASAVNQLCRLILDADPNVQVIVTGGDDIDPDPLHSPEEIERQFLQQFNGSFGVMQPTGDRWMVQNGTCACERVLESPWMGREWIQRLNGGKGPIWHEYFHFFEDEEHFEVAKKLGRLWLRSDLSHYHHHWSREKRPRPQYLFPAKLNWDDAKRLFQARKDAGFPGHEPLGAVNA